MSELLALIPGEVIVPLTFLILGAVGAYLVSINDVNMTKFSSRLLGFTSAFLFLTGLVLSLLLIWPAVATTYETIDLFPVNIETAFPTETVETPVPIESPISSPSSMPNALVFIAISIAIILTIIFIIRKRRRSASIANTTVEEMESSLFEPDFIPVIVQDKNIYGDHMTAYAGIRVDGLEGCTNLKAKLLKVSIDSDGKSSEVDINNINPTGDNLRWNKTGNPCIVKVVNEPDENSYFVFENNRRSKAIKPGDYELKIEIIGEEMKKLITEVLKVKYPTHSNRYHHTGLKWIKNSRD